MADLKHHTNTELLGDAIARSGLKKCYLAREIGVSGGHFGKLVRGKKEFKGSQIKRLCELLHLTAEEMDAIFFGLGGA